jgi:hypothetical protein
MNFINSLDSEWLKTKRSAATWLCYIGGFFIPLISLFYFLLKHSSINSYNTDINIWEQLFVQLWQNMAILLLPMGVILASSLITQIEYKNNTWKQLHATPQTFTNIFFSKISIIIIMTIKFFIFFNIGILLSGIIPCLLFDGHFPKQNIPVLFFIKGNIKYFLTCLPIIAIQYLISLNFKNFLVPIGVGVLGLIGSIIGNSSKYIFISPYSYCAMAVMPIKRDFNMYFLAFFYFIIIMVVSYYLYISKKEKD